MLHEEFAERVAERLEARADTVENEGRLAERGVTALAGDGVTVTGPVEDVSPYLDRAAVVAFPLGCDGFAEPH